MSAGSLGPLRLSVKALRDAVPCNVDALHGFDIAASVGVGKLGGFSVGLAGLLEGRGPLYVEGGEVLLCWWGSEPRARIAFGAVVEATVIALRAACVVCAARRTRVCAPPCAAARSGISHWPKRGHFGALPVGAADESFSAR